MQLEFSIRRRKRWRFFVTVICAIGISGVFRSFSEAQGNTEKRVLRNIVRKLKHISAKDAKKHLVMLKIGRDINQIPGMNALIVTSDNSTDLTKASNLLNLIDTAEPFVIKTILTAPCSFSTAASRRESSPPLVRTPAFS